MDSHDRAFDVNRRFLELSGFIILTDDRTREELIARLKIVHAPLSTPPRSTIELRCSGGDPDDPPPFELVSDADQVADLLTQLIAGMRAVKPPHDPDWWEKRQERIRASE